MLKRTIDLGLPLQLPAYSACFFELAYALCCGRTSLAIGPKSHLILCLQVMAIKFEGKVYKLRVHPGPEGLMKFKDQVRELLGVDITMDFDVSFECQVCVPCLKGAAAARLVLGMEACSVLGCGGTDDAAKGPCIPYL